MKQFLKDFFGLSDDNDRIVREPEFAGVQHPDDPDQLRDVVDGHLGAADGETEQEIRGLIAPYGDYRYAGPVMGAAYATVAREHAFERVLILGASTRVPFRGLAVAGYEAWETPIGESDVDLEVLEQIVESEDVRPIEAAFEPAATLELQLPFIQRRLDRPVVPLLVGDTDRQTVAEMLERFWDDQTLLVLSANLSRGRPASEAAAFDEESIAAVESLEAAAIDRETTDARTALQGLIAEVARRRGRIELIAYRTSSDAEGGADKVVGYGGCAVYSSSPAPG